MKACILIITLIGCLSVCRFFCKVMCPLGAIYGLLNKVSIYHMECNKKTCASCGKCHNVCPMDVDPVKNPNSAECIRCGKCVASCPKESLDLKFVYGKRDSFINVFRK
ncbi:MAG: 4Fe-4S binding protein [Dorea sp.]